MLFVTCHTKQNSIFKKFENLSKNVYKKLISKLIVHHSLGDNIRMKETKIQLILQ